MTRKKPTLEQLLNARRPLMFSRMPRMLRDDGTMAGTLQHEFRYFGDVQAPLLRVSLRRWKIALQMSRILRDQRRRASRAH